MAADVSRAFVYLHHVCSPAVVHRDLKPSNLLVDRAWRVKVADYGLAANSAKQVRVAAAAAAASTQWWRHSAISPPVRSACAGGGRHTVLHGARAAAAGCILQQGRCLQLRNLAG